ncbi:MAG: hypothetical protein RXQ93_01850 [Caldisphaera sp.]|uniref:hypothetical protein n=1 Tax=Caldisphaera sp. TaxID=2060322 RepID=UPI00397A1DC1
MSKQENSLNVIEIEGLAMDGLIKSFTIIQCDKPKEYKKIRAVTFDGREIETACIEPDAANRLAMVMNLYLRNWSKYINWGDEEKKA